MSLELLYTSSPNGLKPGSRGFCTVLGTQGMPAPLATAVEGLSGYRPVFSPSDERAHLNPIVYSHLKLQAAGRSWHVLSRISDYGLDYSGRPNKLAHHVIVDKSSERRTAGPAALLAQPGFMRNEWQGEPKVVAVKPITDDPKAREGVCSNWQEATGDAGWAGVIAESFLANPDRLVILYYQPGQTILPLFEEAISLLPPDKRWNVTFSTYFTGLIPGTTCNWRGILSGTKEANESKRFIDALKIDLSEPPKVPDDAGPLVEAARTGVRPVEVGGVDATTFPESVVDGEEVASEHTQRPPLPLQKKNRDAATPPLRPSSSQKPALERKSAKNQLKVIWIALPVLLLLSLISYSLLPKRDDKNSGHVEHANVAEKGASVAASSAEPTGSVEIPAATVNAEESAPSVEASATTAIPNPEREAQPKIANVPDESSNVAEAQPSEGESANITTKSDAKSESQIVQESSGARGNVDQTTKHDGLQPTFEDLDVTTKTYPLFGFELDYIEFKEVANSMIGQPGKKNAGTNAKIENSAGRPRFPPVVNLYVPEWKNNIQLVKAQGAEHVVSKELRKIRKVRDEGVSNNDIAFLTLRESSQFSLEFGWETNNSSRIMKFCAVEVVGVDSTGKAMHSNVLRQLFFYNPARSRITGGNLIDGIKVEFDVLESEVDVEQLMKNVRTQMNIGINGESFHLVEVPLHEESKSKRFSGGVELEIIVDDIHRHVKDCDLKYKDIKIYVMQIKDRPQKSSEKKSMPNHVALEVRIGFGGSQGTWADKVETPFLDKIRESDDFSIYADLMSQGDTDLKEVRSIFDRATNAIREWQEPDSESIRALKGGDMATRLSRRLEKMAELENDEARKTRLKSFRKYLNGLSEQLRRDGDTASALARLKSRLGQLMVTSSKMWVDLVQVGSTVSNKKDADQSKRIRLILVDSNLKRASKFGVSSEVPE